jgi:chromate transporter
MHEEVVKRRRWLSDQEFLDLAGATNLIPGPNFTEMAIHIGFLRRFQPADSPDTQVRIGRQSPGRR